MTSPQAAAQRPENEQQVTLIVPALTLELLDLIVQVCHCLCP